MRILGELLVLCLGIAVVMVAGRGLTPIAPAIGGFMRALFHPIVLLLLAALFVLFRLGRGRRSKSGASGPSEDPSRADRL